MCNEFALEQNLEELAALFAGTPELPLFGWEGGLLPNNTQSRASIRISDVAPVVRLAEGALSGSMLPWAWKGPNGAPVFNYRTEGRDFRGADRVLVPASGFYEYTTPTMPKVKLKDRHLFMMAGQSWFWMAGLVRDGAFSLLTAEPGPDVAPYHSRGVIPLEPVAGLDWLRLSRAQGEILAQPGTGTLQVQTLRRDGVDL
jgi:putative SOS response-associated peptidase YedK